MKLYPLQTTFRLLLDMFVPINTQLNVYFMLVKREMETETSNTDIHPKDITMKIVKDERRTLDSFSRASRDNVVMA